VGGYWFADGGSGLDLIGSGEPERLSIVFVTSGFFGTLGMAPLAGRLPQDEEMVRGGPTMVWFSHTDSGNDVSAVLLRRSVAR
jgi:hypothetical protein